MAGLAEADLAFGDEIKLKAQPVDPLDVFRGNYVVLSYDISRLQVIDEVRRGQRLCADLFQSAPGVYGARVRVRPAADRGEGRSAAAPATTPRGGESVGIEYGIETYYASAERAEEIESSIAAASSTSSSTSTTTAARGSSGSRSAARPRSGRPGSTPRTRG